MFIFSYLPLIFISFFLLAQVGGSIYLFINRDKYDIKKRAIFISILTGAILLLFIAFTSLVYIISVPTLTQTYPDFDKTWGSYTTPVSIKFNVPVQINELNPKINPSIKGKWLWDNYLGMKGLTMEGKFYPEETLFTGQKMVLYITGVSRVFYDENHEMGTSFNSPDAQSIESVSPKDMSTNVTNNQDIEIKLSGSAHTSEFLFNITPQLDLVPRYPDTNTIILKHTASFNPDTNYKLSIQRRSIKFNFKTNSITEYSSIDLKKDINFKTVKYPLIDSFQPVGEGVKIDEKIIIKFSIPMNRESVEKNIKFDPIITGQFQWSDDLNLIFTPAEPLSKEATYKVIFPKGLVSKDGGTMEKDLSYEFTTLGKVKVSIVSPLNNAQAVSRDTNIRITFNQEVNKSSAQSLFKINPGIVGKFMWDNNTMIFDPNVSYNFDTKYTITIDKGIKSINGLDSVDIFTNSFKTQANQVVIAGIPNRYQPQPSDSCNIYALLMILNWKGYNSLTATNIISEMGYNSSQSGGQWTGNPYKEFVGNADGSWGYGVYWGPVQKVLNNRNISNTLYQNWNLSGIAHAISGGHPVIIWRYNGQSGNYDKSWTASDGAYIYAINGQHGGVVTGFKGDVNNPTEIYLEDPWFGPGWYSASTFDSYWARLNRTGIMIN